LSYKDVITTELQRAIKLKLNKQNMENLKTFVEFSGRLATLLLCLISLEGMATLGWALDYTNYGPLAWVVQSLFFVLCVWGACDWMDASKKQR
jgi:hypothetical protein